MSNFDEIKMSDILKDFPGINENSFNIKEILDVMNSEILRFKKFEIFFTVAHKIYTIKRKHCLILK